jgi:hypothetical protein
MRNQVLALVIAMFMGPALQAAEYCSLIVKVVDGRGYERSAPTVVKERSGRETVLLDRDYQSGGFRFCDLGLSPVTVTVGRNGCPQGVAVYNVPLTWGTTRSIAVTYNDACHLADMATGWYGSGPRYYSCDALFRFRGDHGEPISGVVMRPGPWRADSYGRVHVSMISDGEPLIWTASAPGYKSIELGRACSKETPMIEEDLTMVPTP